MGYPGLLFDKAMISQKALIRNVSLAGFASLVLLLSSMQGSKAEGQSVALARGVAVSSVPDYFARCAGENGQCSFSGPARVIFGASAGDQPDSSVKGALTMQTLNNGAECSYNTFGDPAPGHAKACWVGPVDGLPAGKILSSGGSNYPFSVQNFENWDENQRVVIGNFNLDPNLVEAQLKQIHTSGQSKVTLFIWYMPFDNPMSPFDAIPTRWPDVYSAYINSAGGHLSTQAQQNLKDVLALVKTIGFNHVTLRFAPIGPKADPAMWGNQWNESLFQQDEAFIFNTRAIMEGVLAGTSITRKYDLGVERGGIPHNPNGDGTFTDGQSPEWTARLWSDYVHRFGKSDSYGFSIAYTAGTLAKSIVSYDQAGVRPDNYAIDTYGAADMWDVYQELLAAGDLAKPLIIQETMYNDADEMQYIKDALAHFPLTIAYIQQWPFNTHTPNADGVSPPTNYGAFGGATTASGTIVAYPCTLALGASNCTTTVSWATSNATNVKLLVNGVAATNSPNILTTLTGSATVTLGLTPTTLVLQSDQGVLQAQPLIKSAASSANSLVSASSTVGFASAQAAVGVASTLVADTSSMVLDQRSLVAIDPYAPVLTRVGLGGLGYSSVWALGMNISSNCSVGLFDPNGSTTTAIATVPSVSCQTGSLSFTIPQAVQNAYPAVNIAVINGNGSMSQPIYVKLSSSQPQLAIAGLGGNANQMIWAVGSNFRTGCSINLYDTNASNPSLLQTVRDVSCQDSSLSFTIPSYILANFSRVMMSVTSADGQASPAIGVDVK